MKASAHRLIAFTRIATISIFLEAVGTVLLALDISASWPFAFTNVAAVCVFLESVFAVHHALESTAGTFANIAAIFVLFEAVFTVFVALYCRTLGRLFYQPLLIFVFTFADVTTIVVFLKAISAVHVTLNIATSTISVMVRLDFNTSTVFTTSAVSLEAMFTVHGTRDWSAAVFIIRVGFPLINW